MKKNIIKYIATLMAFVLFGVFAAFGGAGAQIADLRIPLFVVPDAYAAVPGSYFDTGGDKDVTEISGQITATLFGATVKLQGSDDASSISTGNWVDLLPLTSQGAAFGAVGMAVAVNTTVGFVLDKLGVSGAAGLAFRAYRLVAQNTVGASVANITGALSASV